MRHEPLPSTRVNIYVDHTPPERVIIGVLREPSWEVPVEEEVHEWLSSESSYAKRACQNFVKTCGERYRTLPQCSLIR